MRALVLGGYGAVGRRVVAGLRDAGHDAISVGRDPQRADRVVDVGERAAHTAAARDVDVVVNAAGLEQPHLIETITAAGAAVVDVTASTSYVERLEQLTMPRPVVLSVGLAPGMTNLLAADVHREGGGPIDVAVVLGAGETHGAAGVAWTYGLLGRRFADPATQRRVRNYTAARRFELPGLGRRRLYRTDFSDQHTLTRDLGVPVRTYFGLDSRLATTALATLTWIPGARHAPRNVHLPGSERWLVIAQDDAGNAKYATGSGQSAATAALTLAATTLAPQLSAGIHHLHSVMTVDDLDPSLAPRAVSLGEKRGLVR